MTHPDERHDLDPEITQVMKELLEQTAREPVSPRLMALAQRLEEALAEAQKRREAGKKDGKES